MTSTGRLASNHRDFKEFDSVKESISDIINQLQDIDPARLSFSPFLDLDTQISLAPVSDSPESSVEELHSTSHSIPGSQHSLEHLSVAECPDRGHSCFRETCESFKQPKQAARFQEVVEHSVPNDTHIVAIEEDSRENCSTTPLQAIQADNLSSFREERSQLESTNLDSTADEGRSLIRTSPECIELAVWDSQEQECSAVQGSADRGHCCKSRCCLSGRVPALCSSLTSLLCLPWLLYALYVYIPLDAPHCPDLVSRLTFTLHCCAVAAVPVLLAMLSSPVSRFCTASLDPVEELPRRPFLMQLFVSASTEQLFLYTLNLVVMTTFLPQDQLRAVPILAGVFVGGRFVYWLSLHVCSFWRGFGSGLTLFPLVAMVVFNLYCLFNRGFSHLLPGSKGTPSFHTTPSSWPLEMPGALQDFLPTSY